MNIGVHHLGYSTIDKLMAGHWAQPREASGDNAHAVVAFTVSGAGMSRMHMAVIGYFDIDWMQSSI
jgi:integral membrane sensor domain MASE1